MRGDSVKYISGPGSIIIPLETSVYRDLAMYASFFPPSANLGMSATFVNSAAPISSILAGTAASVVAATTVSALLITANTGAYLAGFQFSGDTNGVYAVYVNGTMLMRFTTNIMVPNIDYKFPNPMPLTVGDMVQVYVTNTGDSTASYQVACIGSFPR